MGVVVNIMAFLWNLSQRDHVNGFADHLSFILNVGERGITILESCQNTYDAVVTAATLDVISLFLRHSVCA
jgi:hypothetical protein